MQVRPQLYLPPPPSSPPSYQKDCMAPPISNESRDISADPSHVLCTACRPAPITAHYPGCAPASHQGPPAQPTLLEMLASTSTTVNDCVGIVSL
ncbi:hypothetical protein BOTBODRAFT_199234 [Botryobasidium botryosum FD-172 SS1]|uniref:Uncharacterized protein n=1 Tax=Botryobasidium botryosum (strain FD-172 SS1) TaxID=930990 RepID=A0A067NB71_BOTB1|nr:hypothetical protein BOTBODRAFT_199234 [Botryobasidium botryosum FD-172 SS1]